MPIKDTTKYNLQISNPTLAKEWHLTKNGRLTPKDVTAGSSKKAWWLCLKGHEWDATVANRNKGSGCPYCAGQKATDENCLKTLNPTIAKEWHPTKNRSLTPRDVMAGSNKKAWWQCSKGHEWEAVIASRNSGVGCPFCSNKRINSENNLKVRFPKIAEEWDVVKNNITADKIFPGTIKKYWWLCENGHSYQASPNKRTSSNRGCPYCSGRLVSKKNSFLVHFPQIAKEFHPQKNIGFEVNQLTVKSHKNIWWKCNRGHEWQSLVSNRTRGNNCPFCNSQVSKNELRIYSELKYFFNDIGLKRKVNGFECDILISDLNVAIEYDGAYWHKDKAVTDKKKNTGLLNAGVYLIRVREVGLKKISNNDIIYNHNKQPILVPIKTILQIFINKKWLTKNIENEIRNYLKSTNYVNDEEYRELLERLPSPIFEDSLEFKFPELIKEWDTIKNKGLLPSDVSSKSALKVWWKCNKGHEWESTIGNRTHAGTNCPYCAHQIITNENSLAFKRPDLFKEWNIEKNGTLKPNKIFAYSSKNYWWKCKYGHEWKASPANRASLGKGKNTGCPYCSNRKVNSQNSLAKTNETLASEWNQKKNGALTPTMVIEGSYKKVWWKCNKGHEWEAVISSRNEGKGCPYCSHQKVSLESSLYTKRPDLIKEWNIGKNKDLTPKDVNAYSRKKVWWKCEKGHEWETSVGQRANLNSGCPYCSNLRATKENCLQTNYPEIATEWNYKRNEKLTPSDVTKKSAKLVWWLCKNGHEWTAKVKDRVAGRYKCMECRKKRTQNSTFS